MDRTFKVIGVIDSDSFEVSIHQQLEEYQHTVGLPCVVSTGINSSRYAEVESNTLQTETETNNNTILICTFNAT